LAHALAGARVDETGGYVPLEWEEYRKAWQEARPHGAPPPDGLTRERLAWHPAEADRQGGAEPRAAAVGQLTPLSGAPPHPGPVAVARARGRGPPRAAAVAAGRRRPDERRRARRRGPVAVGRSR